MRGHVPFYQLRNVEGAPRLPADYSTMMLVAWLPPLWFTIMNPRVRLLAQLPFHPALCGCLVYHHRFPALST